jgi:hypothetical protein
MTPTFNLLLAKNPVVHPLKINGAAAPDAIPARKLLLFIFPTP